MLQSCKLFEHPDGFYYSSASRLELSRLKSEAELCNIRVNEIESSVCTSERNLLKEWGVALKFPDYYGHNWDALDECMADREFVPRKETLVIIHDAELLLPKGPTYGLETVYSILSRLPEGVANSNYQTTPQYGFPSLWMVLNYGSKKQMQKFAPRLLGWKLLELLPTT